MTDRNPTPTFPAPPIRRYSLPLHTPQPDHSQSIPKQPFRPVGSTSTSPLLYRDPIFPLRDTSTHAMSSSSSSGSSRRDPPSTAPTTPQLGESSRTWRPTPNVPATMHARHRHNPDPESIEADRNRWLSDGEGSGGTEMAGRRKKRGHRSTHRPSDGYGSSGGGAGTSTNLRPTTDRTKTKHPDLDLSTQHHKRPIVRRAISMETPSQASAPIQPLEEVGAQPPRIQDLIPPPTSPVAIARGLGSGHTTNFTTHVAEESQPQIPDRMELPDFAPGHGSDGINANLRSSSSPRAQSEDRQRKQKDTLAKLRVILAWYVSLSSRWSKAKANNLVISVHLNLANSNLSYIALLPFLVAIHYPQTTSRSPHLHLSSSTPHYRLTRLQNCNNANSSNDYHYGPVSCVLFHLVNDTRQRRLHRNTIHPRGLIQQPSLVYHQVLLE